MFIIKPLYGVIHFALSLWVNLGILEIVKNKEGMSMDNNENGKNTLEAIPVEGTLTAELAPGVVGIKTESEEVSQPEPLIKTG